MLVNIFKIGYFVIVLLSSNYISLKVKKANKKRKSYFEIFKTLLS